MKAVIYYFSGTGNTRRVLQRFQSAWQARGHEATLVPISEKSEPLMQSFDRVIVGFPVHAFNAPKPVLKFLKKLPACKDATKAYLFRVSGEPSKMNYASGIAAGRILKKKGYFVAGEFSHVMPYNIIFRHSDGMAARMDRASELKIPHEAEAVERGVGVRPRVNLLRRSFSLLCKIEHPAMPVIGKTFRVKKKLCVGCGKCERICPRGNITMKNGKPKFGGHCVGCMGCAFHCPKDAIRISLLNGWRVNGEYRFDAEPCSDREVGRYCRKMYLRYFHEAESKNSNQS